MIIFHYIVYTTMTSSTSKCLYTMMDLWNIINDDDDSSIVSVETDMSCCLG